MIPIRYELEAAIRELTVELSVKYRMKLGFSSVAAALIRKGMEQELTPDDLIREDRWVWKNRSG